MGVPPAWGLGVGLTPSVKNFIFLRNVSKRLGPKQLKKDVRFEDGP
jgi:hypothetical protein